MKPPAPHTSAVFAMTRDCNSRARPRTSGQLKTGQDRPQTVAQLHPRLPRELLAGSRHIQAAAPDLPGALRARSGAPGGAR